MQGIELVLCIYFQYNLPVLELIISQIRLHSITKKQQRNKTDIMGQKCCAQMPQRQHFRPIQNKTGPIQSNLIIDSVDVPEALETVPIPTLSTQVQQVYNQLTPFNSKPTNRLKGVSGDPKLLNEEGTVYVGQWKNYMPHGKGVMYFSDGSVYEGIFNEGTPDKEGRLINVNGAYYQGQIISSQANGQGKLVNHHRNYTYEGNWVKDIPHGSGKQKWGDGVYYEGNFLDGKKEGDGKYVNKEFEYKGVFENNEVNHNGQAVFVGGDTYRGMWKNGTMHGHGIYTYKNGSQYQGNFIDGKKNGKGKYKDVNGTVFEGIWKNGKRHGKGSLKVPGLNESLHWEWKNDIPVQTK